MCKMLEQSDKYFIAFQRLGVQCNHEHPLDVYLVDDKFCNEAKSVLSLEGSFTLGVNFERSVEHLFN